MHRLSDMLWLATLVLALVALPVRAQQSNADVLLTATLDITDSSGFEEHASISCRGMPTCRGTYSSRVRHENCSNFFSFSGDITITGLNLAQSGPIQGTITVANVSPIHLANGTCEPGQTGVSNATYTGSWDLARQRGDIVIKPGDDPNSFPLTFQADVAAAPPVFPMVVRSQLGPVTSTVTADIQFRAQDVGKQGGVFVFAAAPAPLVQGALAAKAVHLGFARTAAKADPPACVLAQLNSAGQLVAVSAAQLQAFVTGAFSAAGASVTILNNTPTPRVAGATFYVGYGSTGSAMLDSGVFRNAVLVPGSSTCPPLPYMTSLWWNPGESGWGLNLNQQGGLMFGTLFTYDSTRAPLWLVMPSGSLQADGLTFSGDLYRTTGPAFNAVPFTPIGAANITRVGTMSITFSDADAARLTYSMNGVEVRKSIQRQVFGSRSASCLPTTDARTGSANYQDLWWNTAESGWGLNITHQDNTFFATLFTYDTTGRDLWLVMPGGTRQADGSYLGDLYRTRGAAFDTLPFPPLTGSDVTAVGNMRLRFTDGNNGTLTYVLNGTTVTKTITRQVFSTPQFACN